MCPWDDGVPAVSKWGSLKQNCSCKGGLKTLIYSQVGHPHSQDTSGSSLDPPYSHSFALKICSCKGGLKSLTYSRPGHPHPWDTSGGSQFLGREILP